MVALVPVATAIPPPSPLVVPASTALAMLVKLLLTYPRKGPTNESVSQADAKTIKSLITVVVIASKVVVVEAVPLTLPV